MEPYSTYNFVGSSTGTGDGSTGEDVQPGQLGAEVSAHGMEPLPIDELAFADSLRLSDLGMEPAPASNRDASTWKCEVGASII